MSGFFASLLLLNALGGLITLVGAIGLIRQQSWGRYVLEGVTWLALLYGSAVAFFGSMLLRAVGVAPEFQILPIALALPALGLLFWLLQRLRRPSLVKAMQAMEIPEI